MDLSAGEKATLNFYRWEYRGRGYYHFDEQVGIEPPYVPFRFKSYIDTPPIDDGKVPSLFQTIAQLIEGTPKKTETPKESTLIPNPIPPLCKRIGFSLSFGRNEEISSIIATEFLNMLSSTDAPITFEIFGTHEQIQVQIVSDTTDGTRIHSLLQAYFPTAIIQERNIGDFDFGFDFGQQVAICDFGLSEEFIRPIQTPQSFSIDPLTSIIASLDHLQSGDMALVQIIFKGVTAPWAKDIIYSVSDGQGGSFFSDAPEMLKCAEEKVSSPLFSCVLRIATQSNSEERSQYLATELARNIGSVSSSGYNRLIPLSNEGYEYSDHLYNVHQRTTNRLGMILNSQELVSFVHYPNKSVVSEKLHPQKNKTKSLPKECINQKYILGINEHNGTIHTASINDETFGKHIVIGGSTGTGKTHLLKQFIGQDLELENTAFVIDAHGDLVQDILLTIPDNKKDKIVFINIADEDFSFGFNIFSANSDAEKTVLASDLASAFADTWISTGDRIQSVLQKTLGTLIYSGKEASLLDMKRFLLEEKFRNEFLSLLDDPVLLYYWHNEFPLVRRNELSPLMLRIDAFMQTRLLRNIFAQARGIDFNALVEGKKLVLFQLSVGLIGLENSKFLAKLLIAKINQIAFARQSLVREQRHPIHLYIDEANHYANTSAIEQILSGARKYNLSLVLVLQHLEQVNTNILNSILTNTATQIFFRQSEKDGKRIAPSFSFFEPLDFMELDVGEALVRVNKRSNDFSLTTKPLVNDIPENEAQSTREYIIDNSRKKYAQTKEQIQRLLDSLLPKFSKKGTTPERPIEKLKREPESNIPQRVDPLKEEETRLIDTGLPLEQQKQEYLEQRKEREEVRRHRYLQNLIQQLAQQRGFKTTIEKQTNNGGRIDVVLEHNTIHIAIEVAITNSIDYEVKNVQKCVNDGYTTIWLVSDIKVHLKNIKKRVEKEDHPDTNILFIQSDTIIQHLDSVLGSTNQETKRTKGYRVTTSFKDDASLSTESKQHEITDMILRSIQKKRKNR